LKSPDPLRLLVILLWRRNPLLQFNLGGIEMTNRLVSWLIAGALGATLALASPAFAFHGGGGGGGMHGGGGGGMHFGGGMGGGTHFGGTGGGMHFGGAHFAGAPFAHPGFSPRASRFAFHDRDGFHHRFFHHRFNRFAFIGFPYAYAAYDSCWRRVWTRYGLQWVDVCGNGYY
jgi:hypothetical protein